MREGEGTREPTPWASLAASLAHEIKNPLSTMSISLQLLLEDLQSKATIPSAQVRPRIELLVGEVDRLQKILQDFLRLSREPELELQDRDLNSLIEETEAFIAPELAERNIHLVTQLDRNVATVRVDPDLFRQALLNLLRNAIEAMGQGGTLTVQTRRDGSRFSVEVIDTGSGIPDELKDRIFIGFFSTKRGGTGIGLPLVKQIVELHDGAVSWQSAAGHGTRFNVELPIDGPDGERSA